MYNFNEIEFVLKLVTNYPNDGELGSKYRKYSISYKGTLDEFCLKYPNDYDLGYYLRNKVSK